MAHVAFDSHDSFGLVVGLHECCERMMDAVVMAWDIVVFDRIVAERFEIGTEVMRLPCSPCEMSRCSHSW